MPIQLLEAALALAEMGYAVFPCVRGRKTPLTEHGLLDATTDPARIEEWWREQPSANIGIRTTGLLVVDFEVDATWLAEDPAKLTTLSVAPRSVTAHGGRHFVFRQPEGRDWRNTCRRLALKVDTRGNGGYFIAPPSMLEGNLTYRWVEGHELDVPPQSLPEPPDWLITDLDTLSSGATAARVTSVPAESNQIPSGQRNATLARLGGGMRRNGMTEQEILAALNQVNLDRCVPPIDPREVEQIATSIARYAPDEVAVALAENHWAQLFHDAPEATCEHIDPGPIRESLLTIPGFIAEVMDHTLATAPYPDRALAFGGAMSLQGLLVGRKVRDEADNRTNLYVVNLANSGVGKDHPRKVNQRILSEAGLSNALGDAFASGEGIEDRLLVTPAVLFQTDEIDGLMTKINLARDGRYEWIVSVLLKMYSSANGLYPIRVKAGKEPSVIDQPCLCIYGTAIPKHFYQALSVKMLTNGFLARAIILETAGRGQGQDASVRNLPESIGSVARYWVNFQPSDQGNLGHVHPNPRIIGQTPEAAIILRGHRAVADQRYQEFQDRDDPMGMAIWARANEKARKLALIYACSANHEQPCIDAAAAQWACDFVDHQTRRMLFMAAGNVSENEFDARCKAVVATLTRWRDLHGDERMPFWKLSRKHPWTEREHEEVRTALLSQRVIKYEERTTGGTGQRLYGLA